MVLRVNSDSPKPPASLLGIGLDNEDGHQRITRGESNGETFALVGGSSETHERMTETVMKTFEHLSAKGKRLADVHPKELAEIIHKSTPR
jgi:hypothetical protein